MATFLPSSLLKPVSKLGQRQNSSRSITTSIRPWSTRLPRFSPTLRLRCGELTPMCCRLAHTSAMRGSPSKMLLLRVLMWCQKRLRLSALSTRSLSPSQLSQSRQVTANSKGCMCTQAGKVCGTTETTSQQSLISRRSVSQSNSFRMVAHLVARKT